MSDYSFSAPYVLDARGVPLPEFLGDTSNIVPTGFMLFTPGRVVHTLSQTRPPGPASPPGARRPTCMPGGAATPLLPAAVRHCALHAHVPCSRAAAACGPSPPAARLYGVESLCSSSLDDVVWN